MTYERVVVGEFETNALVVVGVVRPHQGIVCEWRQTVNSER